MLSRPITVSDVYNPPVSFSALGNEWFIARHGSDVFEGPRDDCVEWLLARAHSIEQHSVRVLRRTAGELIKAGR